ncbi:response regulator [bacterium]|nr:response regulator [bacterium]
MNRYSPTQPVELLLVEDDQGDIDLTRESLEENKISVNLNVVRDGVSAMQYLFKQGPYSDATRPDLIILDLNLPKKDGREVLHDIKNDGDIKYIPIVVLTTSESEADILKTYDLGANCYVTKPIGLEKFVKIVQTIEEFWFTVVKLPSR